MNATTNNITVSAPVKTPAGTGIVTNAARGWFTVELNDGTSRKFRIADLSLCGQIREGYIKAGIAVYDPSRYTKHNVRTETGRKAFDIADKVANKLRGKTVDEQYEVAAPCLGTTVAALRAKYGHLNPGQIRMNLGNRMRHA